MNRKRIRSAVLISVLLGLVASLFGQSTISQQKTTRPAPSARMDQFENAHKGMLSTQPDPANEAARLTEAVAKALPAGQSSATPIPRRNLIDEYIFGRIERDRIPHAGLSTDEEFIRRAYLDATGLLPTPQAVREFTLDKRADKRDRLVDSLIGTEKFAEQWAWFFGDLFRLMAYAGGSKNAFQYWNKLWLQVDRPYNEVVIDLLSGSSKSHSSVPQLAFLGRILRNSGLKNRDLTDPGNYAALTNRLDALDEMNTEVSRIFLGVNIDCISCHDGAGHLETLNLYLSERTRKQFSEQAAFFGTLRTIGTYNIGNSDSIMDDDAKGYDTGNDAPFFTNSESRFPRTGETFQPAFMLTGERPKPGVNLREEFGRILTADPQFARATVNLFWGKLMTVGFVEPWDGFDLARIDPKKPPPAPWTIQPTYPELMDALAADFRSHNFSVHHLIKSIMKSSAYQLSAIFPGEWKDSYTPYYARKYVRVMTGPEVVDTIAQATGRPYKFAFNGIEVERIKQLTDLADVPGVQKGGGRGGATSEGADIGSIMNSFFENNREAAPPIGNKPTTLQAMLMMSSSLVNDRVLAEAGSRIYRLMTAGRTDDEIIDELYLSSLSRQPSAAEKKYVLETFPFKTDRKRAAQNLQWVLLNSVEFILNH